MVKYWCPKCKREVKFGISSPNGCVVKDYCPDCNGKLKEIAEEGVMGPFKIDELMKAIDEELERREKPK